MDAVMRAVAMYFFLLVVFRVAGKRTLSEMTTFDLLLLLVLSETTQQAMVGQDHSLIRAFLLVATLVGIDIVLSVAKQRWKPAERWLEGLPAVIVAEGRPVRERMRRLRVEEGDVLAAARKLHGLERMEQVKYAVLECSGGISVIPWPEQPAPLRVSV